MQKIILLLSLLIPAFTYAKQSAFCSWSASERVFQLENKLLLAAKHPGEEMLSASALRQYRQSQRARLPKPKQQPVSDVPTRITGKRGNSTEAVTEITEQNVLEIFNHPLGRNSRGQQIKIDPDHYVAGAKNHTVVGAKAVAFRDADGKVKTIWWSTFEDGKANNIHHRDAIGAYLNKRAENLDKLAEDARGGAQEFLLHESERLKQTAEILGGPSSSRAQNVYPRAVLEETQGFQFRVERDPHKGVVVSNFNVDSGVTSAKSTRTGTGAMKIDVEELAEQIISAHNSIYLTLRGYTRVSLRARFYDRIAAQGDIEKLEELVREGTGLGWSGAPAIKRGVTPVFD